MKPKKNQIMCPDCGKPKMLFETEQKANNFIRWNAEDIEHGEHLRAYYCPSCCGWHISHHRYKKGYESRTENLLEAFERSKKHNSKIDKLIRCDSYSKEMQELSEQARGVYNDIPEEIKALGLKGAIKKYLNGYFVGVGIKDRSGALRGAVYKVWEEDMSKRNKITV